MSKTVKFKPYTVRTDGIVQKIIFDDNGRLWLAFDAAKKTVIAATPAEARALAAQVDKWADAKEEFERVTFAELNFKEWFQFPENGTWAGSPVGPCQKVGIKQFYIERTATMYRVPVGDVTVARLRMTFTPEQEVDK